MPIERQYSQYTWYNSISNNPLLMEILLPTKFNTLHYPTRDWLTYLLGFLNSQDLTDD